MKLFFQIFISTICMFATQGSGQTASYTDEYKLTFYPGVKKNFYDAKTYCSNGNAILAKLDSNVLRTAAADVLKTKSGHLWIGATDAEKESQWKWVDGTSVYSPNWNSGEPNGGGLFDDENCVAIKPTSKWNDENCRDQFEFICRKDVSFPEEIRLGTRWYIFYRRNSERVNFATAAKKCKEAGARLAEGHTNDATIRQKSYAYFANSGKQQYYWMGGSDIISDGTWLWNDKSAIRGGWSINEPSVGSEKNCLASSKDGWASKQCTDTLPYICEKAEVSNVQVSSRAVEPGKESDSVACVADGIPIPVVNWLYGNKMVSSNPSSSVYQTKQDGKSTLYIGNSSITDEGNYTCQGINIVKSISRSVNSALKLTVPSIPVIYNVLVNSCNSSLVLSWSPNKRALGIRHRIALQGDHIKYESYSASNVLEPTTQVFSNISQTAQTRYIITVTPCPEQCHSKYTTTKTAIADGAPNKVSNISVTESTGLKCLIKWRENTITASNSIKNYQITVDRIEQTTGSGMIFKLTPSTASTSGSFIEYEFQGQPNRKYKFGVQARSCAGLGPILWTGRYCLTEKQGDVFTESAKHDDLAVMSHIIVPVFAALVAVLVISGILWKIRQKISKQAPVVQEKQDTSQGSDQHPNFSVNQESNDGYEVGINMPSSVHQQDGDGYLILESNSAADPTIQASGQNTAGYEVPIVHQQDGDGYLIANTNSAADSTIQANGQNNAGYEISTAPGSQDNYGYELDINRTSTDLSNDWVYAAILDNVMAPQLPQNSVSNTGEEGHKYDSVPD